MRPKVGIPRALGYYYMYPFYKTFLEHIGAEIIVSPPTTKATLELMDICPTDEPCMAVKMFYAHTQQLVDMGVNFIWSPVLVSPTKESFCCPKFLGISDMVRNGLILDSSMMLMPRLDHNLSPKEARKPFFEVAARLGVTDKSTIYQALGAAYNAQLIAEQAMVTHGMTCAQMYDGIENVDSLKRAHDHNLLSALSDCTPRVGVIGHPYILYDMLSHNLIDRLEEFGRAITTEMVSREDVDAALEGIIEGNSLWHFESRMLGAALHLLQNHLVEKMVLVGSFECGPESIIESYIEDEAEKQGIPLLLMLVDRQTGDDEINALIEAFMDNYHSTQRHYFIDDSELSGRKGGSSDAFTAHPSPPSWFEAASGLVEPGGTLSSSQMVVGFPSMGYLDIVLRAILEDCGTAYIVNPGTSKLAFELGYELSPESVCFPLAATLGQMRILLDKGANTLFTIGGRERCRLGWYSQIQETVLRRAGYDFDMITLDSPIPLHKNWRTFRDALKHVTGNAPWGQIIGAYQFGYQKLLAIEKAESICRKIRAVERERGNVDWIFSKFLRVMDQATDVATVKREFNDFQEAVRAIEMEDTNPLKVRVTGETWVVLDHVVNQEIEKMLSGQNIRVEVDREISASQWSRQHIFHDRKLRARSDQISRAASAYLSEDVGGHGLASVGATALASKEGCDGVVHIFPATCMPEVIAQNIIVRISDDLEIPILTHIVNDQTSVIELQTRVKAFLDILEERRRHGIITHPWIFAKSA